MRAPFFGAFHALAVDDRRGRARLLAGKLACLHIERMMDAGQRAVALPFDEVVVHRALGRQVLRQLAPLATGRQHVEDGVQDLAPTSVALRRQVRFDQRPFLVRHIARITRRAALVVAPVLRRPHASPPANHLVGATEFTTDSPDSTFFRTGSKNLLYHLVGALRRPSASFSQRRSAAFSLP